MKTALALIGAASALAFGAPAQATDVRAADVKAPATSCFQTRDIRNHTVGDSRTLYFDVAGRAVYRVSMSNSCLAASSSSDPIVLRNFGSSSRICRPLDLDLSAGPSGMSRCIVSEIAKLTPQEVAALPKKLRP